MNTLRLTKDEGFALLSEHNATKAKVVFSGGNDEGSVTSIILTHPDGTTSEVATTHVWVHEGQVTRWEGGERTTRPATEQEVADATFIDVLSAPVYAQWGSFAGDFYVEGAVIWDLTARTVTLRQQVQEPQWSDEEREL